MRSFSFFAQVTLLALLIFGLTASNLPDQIKGDARVVAQAIKSTPDYKTPYLINLNTIVRVVCAKLPEGTSLSDLATASPEKLAEISQKTSRKSGTGTIIAANRVLTAEHVIHGMDLCSIEGAVMATVTYSHLDMDVAVLTADLPGAPVSNISCEPFNKDQPYLMLGYARGTDFALNFSTFTGTYVDIEMSDPGVTGGKRKLPHIGAFNGSIVSGMSGGPVFDLSGRIVGINNATTEAGWFALRQLADTELCTALNSAGAATAGQKP